MDATTSTSSVLRSGHASSPSAKSTCSTDSRSLSYLILDGDLASPSQASRNLYQSHRPCSPSSVSRSESVIIHDQDVGISVAHYLPNDFVTPPTTPVQKRTKPTPPHDHHSTDRPSQGHYVLSPSLKTPKYRIRKKYDPHNANERSFIQAGWEGDVAKIQLLITDGTDIACTDKYGWTAFHRAARYNHVKLCEYFLDEGMDVDITTDDNSSALQLVSLRNHIEVATCLLERKADVNIANEKGYNALMNAADAGCTDMVDLLIQHNSKLDEVDKDGYTSLMWSCKNGHPDVARLLLHARCDAGLFDNAGKTALEHAKALVTTDITGDHASQNNTQAGDLNGADAKKMRTKNQLTELIEAARQKERWESTILFLLHIIGHMPHELTRLIYAYY